MEQAENEEPLLELAAPPTADSISDARQRIDQTMARQSDELAQSVSMLRATLEATTDAILVTDENGIVTDFNQKYLEMWQIPPVVMQVRHHSKLLEICQQRFADPQAFRARVDHIYASAPAENFDLLELLDGRVIERFSNIQRIGDRVVGRVWSFRDITERKRADDQLRQQQEWFRVTLSSIGDAVITCDTQDRVTFMNPVAETMTGWKLKDAVGESLENVFQIINEQTRDPAETPVLRVLRDGSIVGMGNHTSLIARDGRETAIEDSAAPIRDANGEIDGVVMVFHDVTERRRAAEEARRSEYRKSAILSASLDAIITMDHTGNVTDFNPAAERIFGYASDEVLGKPLAELIIPERFRKLHYGGLRRYLDTGERSILDSRVELSALHANGREFPVELSISRIAGLNPPMFTATLRDITERKRAEVALVQSQLRLQLAMEAGQMGDWEWIIATGRVSWSPTLEALHGLAAGTFGGKFDDFQRDMDPLDRDRVLAAIQDCITRRTDYHIEYRIIKPDGKTAWIESRGKLFLDERGQPERMVGICADVTQRKQSEVDLRVSEQFNRTLIDSSRDCFKTLALDGTIQWISETGKDALCISDLSAVIGKSWIDFWQGEERVSAREAVQAAARGGTGNLVGRMTIDGRTRWWDVVVTPILDANGQPEKLLAVSRDITERKQDEQTTRFLADTNAALAELTDYQSTLHKVANLAVPFFADWCAVDMLEPDGSVKRLAITHTDPIKAQLAFELDRRYPARTSDPHGAMHVLQTRKPELVTEIPRGLLESLAQNDEHLQFALTLGFKSYICVPLMSRTRILGAMTFVTAESGRIYDDDDLRTAEDLAHRAAIAIENASLLAALRESDRRKDEFLAMLAHELRNPLAPIHNAVQLLRFLSPPGPELQWAREVIERQVQQMTRLVDDLLDVSRISRGKIELRKAPTELSAVLGNAVESSRPLIEACGHELTVSAPAEAIVLMADQTRLTQVLLNLLNNAAKYMEKGGHIWLTVERELNQVLIRVKDSGIGIPAEMLSRIFEMFTQVDHSLERTQGGLGIGLTLVQRLVELHGGTIAARSAGLGQGSEFIVRLPLTADVEQPASNPQHPEVEPTESQPQGRIMVVDDNPDAAKSLAMVLQMLGHKVQTEHDGLAAVEAARQFKPDVVLLDISLPKLNGYEAAQQIREHLGSDVIIIALTGWGKDEDRQRAQAAGFDQHLTKPVEFRALRSILAQYNLERTCE